MGIPPLFPDDFPVVSSEDELAGVIAAYPQYDSYYVASGSIPARRRRFEYLWAVYHPYSDRQFLREATTSFHQRTWEMYLGAVLRAQDFSLSPPRKEGGPDLRMASPIICSLEAVAPRSGQGPDAVPPMTYGVGDYPEDQLLLRLTTSLDTKAKQYRNHLQKGLVKPDEPYIIAVNSGGLGYPEGHVPLMLKCLFDFSHQVIPLHAEVAGGPFWLARDSVQRKSGKKDVSLKFFDDEQFAGVSAVLYSCTDVLNHPSRLGDDWVMIHNPRALNSIKDETFGFVEQWRMTEEGLRPHPPTR